MEKRSPIHEPIAVIGMACIYPKAKDVKSFWQNILNKVDAIDDPLPAWEAERYLQSGRITTAKGGYLKDLFRFNPAEFGIMPSSVDGGEPDQLLALQVAKQALEDAGKAYLAADFNHQDTGIILGHSTYYHRGQINAAQHHICIDQTLDILKSALPNITTDQEEKLRHVFKTQLPQFNADMCPSEVPNVMTGRIANRLNFNGPNYLVDAACSSSLLAVNAAVAELRSGNSRLMLAGGVNASLPAEVSVIFTMLDALTGKGKVRPFEEGSSGTLLGEGLGIVVLKRLEDAIEDGDRVYALVHGVGQSSDGKGLGLLAPSEKGETLAIGRSYDTSGIDPASISLIEAHGTGIPLGDQTEIASLKNIFGKRLGEQGHIAVGSVKSMISHTIPAAGMASFIKTCMALHHRILPPTLCEKVNPALGIDGTALYVNTHAKPWISAPGKPVRAAINSFGFGGVNTHAILEEAPADAPKPPRFAPFSHELCLLADETIEGLQQQLAALEQFIQHRPDVSLADVSFTLYQTLRPGTNRLALIATDITDLQQKIQQAAKRLAKTSEPLMGRGGVIFNNAPLEGKLAFMFPGEGSQYMEMLGDLACHFPVVRQWFDLWHSLYGETPGSTRTDILFPNASELTPERKAALLAQLHTMDIGSEAVFIAGQAMHSLLRYMGIAPDVMVGHSSGESSALVASQAIGWDTPQDVGDFIRRLNDVSSDIAAKGEIATGALLAIGLMPREKIAEYLDKNLYIAMENCPTQTIVYGSKEAIANLSDVLSKQGAICEILPFDRGYHTPDFAPMQQGFARYYDDIGLKAPKVPLYSCATAALFPKSVKAVRELAAKQWATTVRFVDTINAMEADGIRYFIEVGPGGKLSSFTEQILREQGKAKHCLVSASNVQNQPGLSSFLQLLGKLYVHDKADIGKIFTDRDVHTLDFTQLASPKPKGILLHNTMPRLHATEELARLLQTVTTAIAHTPVENTASDEDPYPHHRPLLSEIVELSDSHILAHATLNLQRDRFLQDHVLSGTVSETGLQGLACVPLMVTLEIMAEAAAVLARSITVTVIEQVKAFDWVALEEEDVTLEVVAQEQNGRFFAQVTRNGSPIMSTLFTFDTPANPCPALPALANPQAFDRWPGEYELYTVGMYHGPLFQSIPTISGWDDSGIDAQLSPVSLHSFLDEGDTPHFILNPVLLDAASQLPAFRDAQLIGPNFYAFPSSIERIELFADCPQDISGLTLHCRKQPGSIHSSRVWNFECRDSYGQPLLRIEGLRDIFFPVPENFRRCLHQPLEGRIGHDTPQGWHTSYLPEEFCQQSGGIFLTMLAYCYLNDTERAEWLSVKTLSQNEIKQWLFERICVKELIQKWLYHTTGHLAYPVDIATYATAPEHYLAEYGQENVLVTTEESKEGVTSHVTEETLSLPATAIR